MEQSLFKFYRILTVVYIYIYWKWFWLISEPIEYKKVVTDEFKVSPPHHFDLKKTTEQLDEYPHEATGY